MTVKQFRKKAQIARKCGEAWLDDGMVLYFWGNYWSVRAKDGNTVSVADTSKGLEFLFE